MALSSDREGPHCALDFVDFAQEFLRRNSEYRRQHAELLQRREEVDSIASMRMAHSWGLEFPVRS